jgi:hypothetical protein
MVRIAWLVAAGAVWGCGANARYAPDCSWASHDSRRLNLSVASDVRHLSDDAQMAEDVAIRHADLGQARALHSTNPGPYRHRREACKAQLFATIASHHGVPVDAVTAAVARRRTWLDAIVMLGFAVIYLAVAQQVAQRLLGGALADSRVLAAAVSLAAAGAFALVGLFAGEVWSAAIESIRVGNGHMSYRVERIPWRQYPIPLFIAGVALFMLVAATTWNAQRRSA